MDLVLIDLDENNEPLPRNTGTTNLIRSTGTTNLVRSEIRAVVKNAISGRGVCRNRWTDDINIMQPCGATYGRVDHNCNNASCVEDGTTDGSFVETAAVAVAASASTTGADEDYANNDNAHSDEVDENNDNAHCEENDDKNHDNEHGDFDEENHDDTFNYAEDKNNDNTHGEDGKLCNDNAYGDDVDKNNDNDDGGSKDTAQGNVDSGFGNIDAGGSGSTNSEAGGTQGNTGSAHGNVDSSYGSVDSKDTSQKNADSESKDSAEQNVGSAQGNVDSAYGSVDRGQNNSAHEDVDTGNNADAIDECGEEINAAAHGGVDSENNCNALEDVVSDTNDFVNDDENTMVHTTANDLQVGARSSVLASGTERISEDHVRDDVSSAAALEVSCAVHDLSYADCTDQESGGVPVVSEHTSDGAGDMVDADPMSDIEVQNGGCHASGTDTLCDAEHEGDGANTAVSVDHIPTVQKHNGGCHACGIVTEHKGDATDISEDDHLINADHGEDTDQGYTTDNVCDTEYTAGAEHLNDIHTMNVCDPLTDTDYVEDADDAGGTGDKCHADDAGGTSDKCHADDAGGTSDKCHADDADGTSDKCHTEDVDGIGHECDADETDSTGSDIGRASDGERTGHVNGLRDLIGNSDHIGDGDHADDAEHMGDGNYKGSAGHGGDTLRLVSTGPVSNNASLSIMSHQEDCVEPVCRVDHPDGSGIVYSVDGSEKDGDTTVSHVNDSNLNNDDEGRSNPSNPPRPPAAGSRGRMPGRQTNSSPSRPPDVDYGLPDDTMDFDEEFEFVLAIDTLPTDNNIQQPPPPPPPLPPENTLNPDPGLPSSPPQFASLPPENTATASVVRPTGTTPSSSYSMATTVSTAAEIRAPTPSDPASVAQESASERENRSITDHAEQTKPETPYVVSDDFIPPNRPQQLDLSRTNASNVDANSTRFHVQLVSNGTREERDPSPIMVSRSEDNQHSVSSGSQSPSDSGDAIQKKVDEKADEAGGAIKRDDLEVHSTTSECSFASTTKSEVKSKQSPTTTHSSHQDEVNERELDESVHNDFHSVSDIEVMGAVVPAKERTDQDADDLLDEVISGKEDKNMGPKDAEEVEESSLCPVSEPIQVSTMDKVGDEESCKSGTDKLPSSISPELSERSEEFSTKEDSANRDVLGSSSSDMVADKHQEEAVKLSEAEDIEGPMAVSVVDMNFGDISSNKSCLDEGKHAPDFQGELQSSTCEPSKNDDLDIEGLHNVSSGSQLLPSSQNNDEASATNVTEFVTVHGVEEINVKSSSINANEVDLHGDEQENIGRRSDVKSPDPQQSEYTDVEEGINLKEQVGTFDAEISNEMDDNNVEEDSHHAMERSASLHINESEMEYGSIANSPQSESDNVEIATKNGVTGRMSLEECLENSAIADTLGSMKQSDSVQDMGNIQDLANTHDNSSPQDSNNEIFAEGFNKFGDQNKLSNSHDTDTFQNEADGITLDDRRKAETEVKRLKPEETDIFQNEVLDDDARNETELLESGTEISGSEETVIPQNEADIQVRSSDAVPMNTFGPENCYLENGEGIRLSPNGNTCGMKSPDENNDSVDELERKESSPQMSSSGQEDDAEVSGKDDVTGDTPGDSPSSQDKEDLLAYESSNVDIDASLESADYIDDDDYIDDNEVNDVSTDDEKNVHTVKSRDSFIISEIAKSQSENQDNLGDKLPENTCEDSSAGDVVYKGAKSHDVMMDNEDEDGKKLQEACIIPTSNDNVINLHEGECRSSEDLSLGPQACQIETDNNTCEPETASNELVEETVCIDSPTEGPCDERLCIISGVEMRTPSVEQDEHVEQDETGQYEISLNGNTRSSLQGSSSDACEGNQEVDEWKENNEAGVPGPISDKLAEDVHTEIDPNISASPNAHEEQVKEGNDIGPSAEVSIDISNIGDTADNAEEEAGKVNEDITTDQIEIDEDKEINGNAGDSVQETSYLEDDQPPWESDSESKEDKESALESKYEENEDEKTITIEGEDDDETSCTDKGENSLDESTMNASKSPSVNSSQEKSEEELETKASASREPQQSMSHCSLHREQDEQPTEDVETTLQEEKLQEDDSINSVGACSIMKEKEIDADNDPSDDQHVVSDKDNVAEVENYVEHDRDNFKYETPELQSDLRPASNTMLPKTVSPIYSEATVKENDTVFTVTESNSDRQQTSPANERLPCLDQDSADQKNITEKPPLNLKEKVKGMTSELNLMGPKPPLKPAVKQRPASQYEQKVFFPLPSRPRSSPVNAKLPLRPSSARRALVQGSSSMSKATPSPLTGASASNTQSALVKQLNNEVATDSYPSANYEMKQGAKDAREDLPPSAKVILDATDRWLNKISDFCKSPTQRDDKQLYDFAAQCKSEILNISHKQEASARPGACSTTSLNHITGGSEPMGTSLQRLPPKGSQSEVSAPVASTDHGKDSRSVTNTGAVSEILIPRPPSVQRRSPHPPQEPRSRRSRVRRLRPATDWDPKSRNAASDVGRQSPGDFVADTDKNLEQQNESKLETAEALPRPPSKLSAGSEQLINLDALTSDMTSACGDRKPRKKDSMSDQCPARQNTPAEGSRENIHVVAASSSASHWSGSQTTNTNITGPVRPRSPESSCVHTKGLERKISTEDFYESLKNDLSKPRRRKYVASGSSSSKATNNARAKTSSSTQTENAYLMYSHSRGLRNSVRPLAGHPPYSDVTRSRGHKFGEMSRTVPVGRGTAETSAQAVPTDIDLAGHMKRSKMQPLRLQPPVRSRVSKMMTMAEFERIQADRKLFEAFARIQSSKPCVDCHMDNKIMARTGASSRRRRERNNYSCLIAVENVKFSEMMRNRKSVYSREDQLKDFRAETPSGCMERKNENKS